MSPPTKGIMEEKAQDVRKYTNVLIESALFDPINTAKTEENYQYWQ